MLRKIAFELYQVVETRMGGLDFALIMKDGNEIPFCYISSRSYEHRMEKTLLLLQQSLR